MESAFGKSIVNRRRFSLQEVDFGCGDGRRIIKGLEGTANSCFGLCYRYESLF
jgi:hypothetical protein